LAVESESMARGQAQELMGQVDRVLIAAGVEPQDLDAVAVTRGPGAFTGLRIALAAAKGFALALGIPCIGVTTLEVVAAGVPEAERKGTAERLVLACVESKRDDIFVQIFSSDVQPLSDPLACNAAELKGLFATGERIVLVGDAAERALAMLHGAEVDAVLSTAQALPDPAIIATLAAPRLCETHAMPEPLYIRPPDAVLPKAEGRLRS
jgi:tRNA threonylcarbamoyladenosine biosynthesis protein TsaB